VAVDDKENTPVAAVPDTAEAYAHKIACIRAEETARHQLRQTFMIPNVKLPPSETPKFVESYTAEYKAARKSPSDIQHILDRIDITDDSEELVSLTTQVYDYFYARSAVQDTPAGTVVMQYDCAKQSFVYYSDNDTIPFTFLEVVARKYVSDHSCAGFYLEPKYENALEVETRRKLEEQEEINRSIGTYNTTSYLGSQPRADLKPIPAHMLRRATTDAHSLVKVQSNRFTRIGRLVDYATIQFQKYLARTTTTTTTTPTTQDAAATTTTTTETVHNLSWKQFKQLQKEEKLGKLGAAAAAVVGGSKEE
jgi:hypothetical protein